MAKGKAGKDEMRRGQMERAGEDVEANEKQAREEKDERMKGEKIMGKIADISKHQGKVDWEQAAGELDMVILRNGIMLCWAKSR